MRRRPEIIRSAFTRLAPAAALALIPKCALCVAAYLGLGEALGLGGRELCGKTGGAGPFLGPSLCAATLGVAVAEILVRRRRRARGRPAQAVG